MPKKKNTRNAGRKKTRDWTPVKIGPFDVHPDVKKDWLAICEANGSGQVEQFRRIVKNLVDDIFTL